MMQSETMPLKTVVPNVGTVVGLKWYSAIPQHALKALFPILVTTLGIVMLARE